MDFPLDEIEIALKELWTGHPELNLNMPCSRETVNPLLDRIFHEKLGPSLEEKNFISDAMDIAFVRHKRYLPAFSHQHAFFEMLYIIRGTCNNYISDHCISMQRGDISIMAPGTAHSVSAFSNDAVAFNILLRKSSFESAFMSAFYRDDILSDFFMRILHHTGDMPYIYFKCGPDEYLENVFWRAYGEYGRNARFKKEMCNTLLTEFMLTLLRRHEHHVELRTIDSSKSNETIIYMLQYIQKHFDTVSLGELSDFFHYSQRQIQRMIEAATGRTFSDIIRSQKMSRARLLLLTTDMPITTISSEVGFGSIKHFQRTFRKYYNTSPSQMRKEEGMQQSPDYKQ